MHPVSTPNGCPDNSSQNLSTRLAIPPFRIVPCSGWGCVTFGFKGAAYAHASPPQGLVTHPVNGAFEHV